MSIDSEKLRSAAARATQSNTASKSNGAPDFREFSPVDAYEDDDTHSVDEQKTDSDPYLEIRTSICADLAVGAAAIDEAKSPEMVVHKRLPVAGANLAGTGGAGKTTLVLNEYVHIIGGGQLYGEDVIQKGMCVLVTAEDGAEYPRYLLKRVLEDGVRHSALPEVLAEHAKTAIKIVGWSRPKFGPIAIADRDGNIYRAPGFDVMLELFAPLKPAVVMLDPAVLFSPGERFGNDAESFIAAQLHEAALSLGCMFQVLDHVSQAVAISGSVHQHAARGGTAKTDNARLARQLVRFRPGDSDTTGMPLNITAEDVANGRILQLHWTKANYFQIPPFAWLRRSGYWIDQLRSASSDQRNDKTRQENQQQQSGDESAVIATLKRLSDAQLSKKRFEDHGVSLEDGNPMPRARLRGAVERLLAAGKVRQAELPKDQVKGGMKYFLSLDGTV